MGATLVWPAVTVLGFLFFTGLVVALGASTTARYEFERNGARAPQRSAAESKAAHPAGSAAPARPSGPAQGAVDVAVRPAATATGEGPAWWLLGESAQVLAGPFADRIDAEWAALSGELPAVAVHGSRRTDGGVVQKPSPQERAWLAELGEQLDRLPDDWDDLLTDTDPLTTLLVEVAAALVEAGLPLHDTTGGPAGGVALVPEPASRGVLVGWRAHDRMSLEHVRGADADTAVQEAMNAAVTEVLAQLGFVVEPYGAAGGCLVTALR